MSAAVAHDPRLLFAFYVAVDACHPRADLVHQLTLTERQEEFGREVTAQVAAAGFRVELDDRNEKLGYKIRAAQLEKVPYMLVVGDKEEAARTVAPRARSGENLEPMSVEAFVDRLRSEARPGHS